MANPKANVEEIRAQLLKDRKRTLAEIERLREGMTYELETTSEEGEPDIWEREKTLSLVRSMENNLAEIDRALRMTERGDYGTCERCGKPIDPARLKAMPTTTLCLQCKQELEAAAKSYTPPSERER
jgi:DnaK suppressor protein